MSPRLTRRQRRADALRRQALSPLRILLMVLALPLTTGMIAIGVYLRISDFERHEAVIHLVALAGCDTVQRIVQGPFFEGRPGYHKRNDPDGDGVACGSPGLQKPRNVAMPGGARSAPQSVEAPKERTVGTAKFLKP
ncbi:excalibur calcium-binding domain-containing protein [Ruegeria halocynthiae]|uniref:excalibur calcium-binding domain-containing protein n=1 Tax=Ruegeria halocynthiae TaxID=985054 RepID=UPI001FDF6F05|nr:excalibur calcium-binding domain-containing protein [Ruegeria halocynthiae]